MPTFYGDKYTDAFVSVPRANVDAADAVGRVRAIFDVYEATGEAIASVLNMGGAKVPKGARIIEAWLDFDALGASSTLALSSGAKSLIAATSTSSAGRVKATLGLLDYTAAAEETISILTAGGTITGTVTACVIFLLD